MDGMQAIMRLAKSELSSEALLDFLCEGTTNGIRSSSWEQRKQSFSQTICLYICITVKIMNILVIMTKSYFYTLTYKLHTVA